MQKNLSQDWLNWIFENIQKGCDKNQLLAILLEEGFSISQCKIALGLDLTKGDLDELKKLDSDKRNYLPNKNISATQIKDVQAEIYEINSFLTKEECKRLIFEIKRTLRPSTIASAGEYDPTYRTSSTCDLGRRNDPFLRKIDKKICDFIGIDRKLGETLQGQHYLEGQEFKAHTDYFEVSQLQDYSKNRGQRSYTFMVYLNDVNEGGETEFPVLDKVFSPIAGKGIIWNNLNEDGSPNENTMHQAHPVLKGEKTIITKWFREKL